MNRPITLVSRNAVNMFAGSCADARVVGSLREVATALSELEAADNVESHTLDLTGHTRRGTKLLAIGRDTIDMLAPAIEEVMHRLAESRVLDRLRIHALRLIGCETAVSPAGQVTMKRLASIIGMPVYGTRKRIANGHYNRHGFDPIFEHLLIESAQLPTIPERLPLAR